MTQASSTSGQKFASDLRKIREARGISMSEVHDETKIPMGLIESFEETGLVDHPMFNRVYLRSFVRTYAEVVGISPDVALAALDESIEGHYRDRLAVEYLGVEPAPPPAPPAPEPGETAAASTDVTKPAPPAEPPAEPKPVSSPNPMPSEPKAPEAAEPEEEVTPSRAKPPEHVREEPAPPARVYAEEKPKASTPVVPPSIPATRRPVERAAARGQDTSRRGIWIGAAVVVLVAVAAWFFFTGEGAPEPEEVVAGPEAEVVSDTSGVVAPREAPAAPVAIGDSMDVTIVAAGGPVQNIKVTVDEDLRRPYWIEEGQSRTFLAANQIIIERQLDKVQLLLEGQPYPTDELDEQGRIVITRDRAEQYLAQAR